MGYTTKFNGVLKIEPELTASQLVYLKKFLGEDCREHKDWPKNKWLSKLYYTIDLVLTEDMMGLQWNGSEKSYEMEAFTFGSGTATYEQWMKFIKGPGWGPFCGGGGWKNHEWGRGTIMPYRLLEPDIDTVLDTDEYLSIVWKQWQSCAGDPHCGKQYTKSMLPVRRKIPYEAVELLKRWLDQKSQYYKPGAWDYDKEGAKLVDDTAEFFGIKDPWAED